MIITRRHRHTMPQLNTASLPDLIFTVLFFFMIVAHMRNTTPRISIEEPRGENLVAQNRQGDIYLYVSWQDGQLLTQLNNDLIPSEQLPEALAAATSEATEQPTVILKADRQTPMHCIQNVKLMLRNAGLQNIKYAAIPQKQDPH